MNNSEKGHLTETMVKAKLIELGYRIFNPAYSSDIIDLVLLKNDVLYKVQIKTMGKQDDGQYVVYTSSTTRIKGEYVCVSYPEESIDFFIAYNTDDKIFIAFSND